MMEGSLTVDWFRRNVVAQKMLFYVAMVAMVALITRDVFLTTVLSVPFIAGDVVFTLLRRRKARTGTK